MPLPPTTPMDPWDTRFGFFWYNDQEIFHASQEDLNRQAEALAETGINHVITFSCTHFRWSFRRHWGAIEDALARVVNACHGHGIRVTEHHSSHLTFNPLNDDDLAEFVKLQKKFADSDKSWSVKVKDIDSVTFDLSAKNPNGGEEITLRSPAAIMQEIAALDAESTEVLENIRSLL